MAKFLNGDSPGRAGREVLRTSSYVSTVCISANSLEFFQSQRCISMRSMFVSTNNDTCDQQPISTRRLIGTPRRTRVVIVFIRRKRYIVRRMAYFTTARDGLPPLWAEVYHRPYLMLKTALLFYGCRGLKALPLPDLGDGLRYRFFHGISNAVNSGKSLRSYKSLEMTSAWLKAPVSALCGEGSSGMPQ